MKSWSVTELPSTAEEDPDALTAALVACLCFFAATPFGLDACVDARQGNEMSVSDKRCMQVHESVGKEARIPACLLET